MAGANDAAMPLLCAWVFQVHGVDAEGNVLIRRQLKRRYILAFFEKLPPCLVGIEACATSHHWSRQLKALGHTVRLMPPAYVKPYVKRQKNDAADAEAICEAVTRANMRFVEWSTGGQEQRRTVDTTENTSPIVVHVPEDFRVQLFAAGNDPGGVQTIGFSGRVVSPNSVSYLEFPGHAFVDCAKTYRAVTEFVERSPSSRTVELQVSSKDFHDNSSTTPTLTLIFDQ